MMQHQTGPNYADNYEGMRLARAAASLAAVVEECPAAVWVRDGWLAVSTVAPDCDESDTREADGWTLTVIEYGTWSEVSEYVEALEATS